MVCDAFPGHVICDVRRVSVAQTRPVGGLLKDNAVSELVAIQLLALDPLLNRIARRFDRTILNGIVGRGVLPPERAPGERTRVGA